MVLFAFKSTMAQGQGSRNMAAYDLCIVGAGLIGSAAARHATLLAPNLKICLVGPKEPEDRLTATHGIYGAYYDEGRITRSLDPDPIWADLADRSIQRYREIERMSGVQFFTEVGYMTVGIKGHAFLQNTKDNAKDMKVNVQILEKNDVAEKFPFLSISSNEQGVLQTENAGHVNPRAQVTAQQTVAQKQGCDIIDDVVDKVTEITQEDSSKCMEVTTAKGRVMFARKVLLTTGAFTGFRELLPPGKVLDTMLRSQTVVFAEITDADAERLKDMPCIIWKFTLHDKYDCYILPPIKYPDGKYYLKIGHGDNFEKELKTAEEVADWFRTEGDKMVYQPLRDILFDIVKGVSPISIHGDCCVTTHTPTHQLYCDMVTPTLGVTVGGSGYAAKSADEIGRMGARMVIAGRWAHHLPQERFKARFKGKSSKL